MRLATCVGLVSLVVVGCGGAPARMPETLVASRDGTLAAHEPDGALRWRMNLAGPLRPPVVALSPGRVAVATERSEILVLELAARDEPR